MFVYIFCIVWATLFVFLAERQFKKIPVEDERKKSGSRFVLRKKEKKDTVQNDDATRPQQTEVPLTEREAMKLVEKKDKNDINNGNKIDVVFPTVILPVKPIKQDVSNHDDKRDESSYKDSGTRGRRIIEIMQYEDTVKKEKEIAELHTVGDEILRKSKADRINQKIGEKAIKARNSKYNVRKIDDVKTPKHVVKKIDDVKVSKNHEKGANGAKISKNNTKNVKAVEVQKKVNEGGDKDE